VKQKDKKQKAIWFSDGFLGNTGLFSYDQFIHKQILGVIAQNFQHISPWW